MSDDTDPIWKALSDSNRRRILDLLRDQPRTTGEVCLKFASLSRFAVMKHLGILQRAGLLIIERRGRERYNYLNPVPIRQIYERWITRFTDPPARLATSLKKHIESKSNKGNIK